MAPRDKHYWTIVRTKRLDTIDKALKAALQELEGVRTQARELEELMEPLLEGSKVTTKAEVERTHAFLEAVRDKQEEELQKIKLNGFVFDDLEDRWQKLAFTFYSDIAELSMIARNLLAEEEESRCGEAP